MKGCRETVRVLLVAPLPPPAGGIATWTNILLREIQHHSGVTIKLIDVAVRWIKRENRSQVLRVIGGSLQAVRDIARVMIAMATFRPHVLHLTTIAGHASLKDVVMMWLARLFRVVGLHPLPHLTPCLFPIYFRMAASYCIACYAVCVGRSGAGQGDFRFPATLLTAKESEKDSKHDRS